MAAKKPAAKTAPKTAPIKKAPAKPAPTKKATINKAPTKKAAAPKQAATRKTSVIAEKYTKSQVVGELAENTGLNKVQVNAVLDELTSIIERHIKKRGAGEFSLPGLLKIKTVKKPARKARKGVNPFTGEQTTFKARPASTAVKVTALKGLKDMAN